MRAEIAADEQPVAAGLREVREPEMKAASSDAVPIELGTVDLITERREMGEADTLGPVLAGKYLIQKRIGQGGMGEVYLAVHQNLNKRVAIKRLLALVAGNSDARKRFVQEAQQTACIDHPNVVAVTDIDYDPDGHPFFVMEHIEGETLRALIDREGALPPARAADIAIQVCDALVTAHRSVVHRDLKPSNIMVQRRRDRDFVKILDFGIAKLLGDRGGLTGTGRLVGTPGYMAPELLRGDEIKDARLLDVYQVGMILYVMLAGRPPWSRSASPAEIAVMQQAGLPALRKFAPGCPVALEAIASRALATDPGKRYGSAEALLAALEGFRHPKTPVPQALAALAEGDVIDGKYRIVRQLGEGGYGLVYLAEDLLVRRPVALKFLRAEHRLEQLRARFFQDAELAARIDHPHVIRVHGAGIWSDHPYLVLEYVDGETLRARWGSLSWSSLVDVVGQVASALDAIHAAQIVHRDLSPENILLDRGSPRARITDFGIARKPGSDLTGTSGGQMLGRLGYMAPEQVTGEGVGAATDQWALATIVYEALTGSPPFFDGDGDSDSGVQEDVANRLASLETPPPPSKTNRSVPAAIDTVVLRGLAPRPEDRFPNAGAFAAALKALANKNVVPAVAGSRDTSTANAWSKEATAKAGGRRRWVLAVGAAIALGTAAFVFGTGIIPLGRGHNEGTPAASTGSSAPVTAVTTTTFDAGLARLDVKANVDGSVMAIDGHEVSLPSLLERPAGTRLSVTVKKPGYEEQVVDLVFGDGTVSRTVELRPSAVSAAPPTPASTSVPARSRRSAGKPSSEKPAQVPSEEELYRRPDVIIKKPPPK